MWVSSPTYKGLGSHHSILNKYKAKQTEKSAILLGYMREGRTKSKPLPLTGETDKQIQVTSRLTRTGT